MDNNQERKLQIAKIYNKWQQMTITSDPMFGLVMQNKNICLELINRALPYLCVKQIVRIGTQKDINVVDAHGVRFDVYAKDENDNIFVIEMQVNDQGNLPERLRYYQEQIDHDLLKPNDDYSVLSKYPTYVIMFCTFDYFKCGLARYEFELTCTDDPTLKFNDQRRIIVFNALAEKFTKQDQPIKDFLALMRNQVDNNSRFVEKIQAEISKVKRDPERRNGFMKYELNMMDAKRAARAEGRKKGLEEGRNEGLEQGRKEGLKKGHKEAKENDIKILIATLQELNFDSSIIKQKLTEKYHLTNVEIDKLLNK